MKRFHIHVGVTDLEKSVQFYSTLFGQKPTKLKGDYAKWMLEDPKINFAISKRCGVEGVNHLGLQVENAEELAEITSRLKTAEIGVHDEGESTCCYARSNKAWAQDPAGIPWETYQTMADAEVYSEPREEQQGECCVPEMSGDEAAKSCC